MKYLSGNIRFLFLTFAFAGQMFLQFGCRTPEDEQRERMEKADRYFRKIKDRTVPQNKVFALQECIDTSLKNNLDLKVYELTEKINKERSTSAYLEMLPDLYATYDLTSRNNEPGATSMSIETNKESLEPSRSTEKTVGVFKVELAFSVVDFGLSYLKALQQDDKSRMTIFQRNRAAQNLTFDVARSFYRVAAAQHAMENTEKLLKLSMVVEKNLDYIAKAKTLSPLRILAEKKQILELKQDLEEYRRVYENSCIELKTLMGYAPWNEIKVDTTCFDNFTEIELPDIGILEQLAIRKRPELFQMDTHTHMSVLEARKAILMMFPNVKMFIDFTNSSNSLLYHLSWWEIGIRCAYHLLRLPQQIKEWQALDMEIDEMEARTLALTSGVMAQVRIAHANLLEVKKRYKLTELIYETNLRQLRAAKADAKAGGRISQIELFKMAMETANASIERSQQLGNYYLAYYRLLNATGLKSLDDILKAKEILEELKKEQNDPDELSDEEVDKLFEDDPEYVKMQSDQHSIKAENPQTQAKNSAGEKTEETVLPKNTFSHVFNKIRFTKSGKSVFQPLENKVIKKQNTNSAMTDKTIWIDDLPDIEVEELPENQLPRQKQPTVSNKKQTVKKSVKMPPVKIGKPAGEKTSSIQNNKKTRISQKQENRFSLKEKIRLNFRDFRNFLKKTGKTLADVRGSVVQCIEN